MPQSVFNHSDNGLTDAASCQLLSLPPMDTGSGVCQSYAYPKYSTVYSYECYSGSVLCQTWCLNSEAYFSRLMAFAAAIRWDMESDSDN